MKFNSSILLLALIFSFALALNAAPVNKLNGTHAANVTIPANATNGTKVTIPANGTNSTNVTIPANVTNGTDVTVVTNVTIPANGTNSTNATNVTASAAAFTNGSTWNYTELAPQDVLSDPIILSLLEFGLDQVIERAIANQTLINHDFNVSAYNVSEYIFNDNLTFYQFHVIANNSQNVSIDSLFGIRFNNAAANTSVNGTNVTNNANSTNSTNSTNSALNISAPGATNLWSYEYIVNAPEGLFNSTEFDANRNASWYSGYDALPEWTDLATDIEWALVGDNEWALDEFAWNSETTNQEWDLVNGDDDWQNSWQGSQKV